ncbi:MAG: tol-pal system protein YbgF [Deltaproteobacteria bacterium]|nr:tol-pal system protein YbgF [Deltaproteobacteria bacterium]
MTRKPSGLSLIMAVAMILLSARLATAGFEETYQQGRVLYLEENYDQAAQAFSRLTLQYPDHRLIPDAVYWLGKCYFAQKLYQRAMKEFEWAAQISPSWPRTPDALLMRAYSLSRLGKQEAATAGFKNVIARYPDSQAAEKARQSLGLEPKNKKDTNTVLPEIRAARAVLGEKVVPLTPKKKSSGQVSKRQVRGAAGMSDIMEAITQADLATFKTILAKYPYVVEFRDREGNTPLHKTAAYNRPHMASLLLAQGADADADSRSYVFIYTPLHEAVRHNNIEMVELLLANGAKIDAGRYIRRREWSDRYAFTPLLQAVRYNHLEMVKLLLEKGADPNISAHPATGETPLRLARRKGFLDIAEVLKTYLAVH